MDYFRYVGMAPLIVRRITYSIWLHNSKAPALRRTQSCLLGLWQGDCKLNGANWPVGCRERDVMHHGPIRPKVFETLTKR
eukprot:scaffold8423_cov96-Skeletonema_menzelii.AAC.1